MAYYDIDGSKCNIEKWRDNLKKYGKKEAEEIISGVYVNVLYTGLLPNAWKVTSWTTDESKAKNYSNSFYVESEAAAISKANEISDSIRGG